MRACGGCFWGVFTYGEEWGACHNRPPFVAVLPGRAAGEFQTITTRPEVQRNDKGCFVYRHPKAPPKDEGGAPE
jgi:hypothetical protein